MISETQRQMTAEERAMLQTWIISTPKPEGFARSVLVGSGLLVAALLLVVAFVFLLTLRVNLVLLVIAAVIMFFVGFGCVFIGGNMISSTFGLMRIRRNLIKTQNPRIAEALLDGKVRVLSVEADSVVHLEEFEDEGSAFLFSVEPTRTLILKGQDIYPVEQSMPWPAQRFEIIRTVLHDIKVGVVSSGTELVPKFTRPLYDCNEDFIWSEKQEIIDKPVDQVLRSLLKPNRSTNS